MVRNGINQCKVTAPALGLFKMNSIAQLSRRQCHADILLEAAERPLVWVSSGRGKGARDD